jgi:hypothetical protein
MKERVVLSLCSLLLLAACAYEGSAEHPGSPLAQNECMSAHGGIAEKGLLSVRKDDKGKVMGWTCAINSHSTCTAGPNGVWMECTFSPDVMPWPQNVSAEVLRDPSLVESPGAGGIQPIM